MVAAFTGSFDPVTYGHLDLIKRSQAMVDKLVIVVTDNLEKNRMFSAEERVYMVKEATRGLAHVSVEYHSGLLVDFLYKNKINLIIRGLRSVGDFEYEMQLSLINKMLLNSLETLFIPADPRYIHLSSSAARQIACCGGNLDSIVPECVKQQLVKKILML